MAKSSLTPIDRFMQFVSPEPNTGCWLWMSTENRKGYGMFKVGIRNVMAHRFSFAMAGGILPPGLMLDHLCRQRCCVNPRHLEPVTNRENCRRGKKGVLLVYKTHCPHGHEYSGRNLMIPRTAPNQRMCRTCVNDRQRAKYHEMKYLAK